MTEFARFYILYTHWFSHLRESTRAICPERTRVRIGDSGLSFSGKRQGRFESESNLWFFTSREGIRFGGFHSQFDAQLAACLLFTRVSQADDPSEVRTIMASFSQAPPVPVSRTVTEVTRTDLPNAERPTWQAQFLRLLFEPALARSS